MFKNYLRIQPVAVQLLILLTFWSILTFFSIYLSQFIIIKWTGISSSQLPAFVENEMFKIPNLVFLTNALFSLFTFFLPAVIFAYLADPKPVKYLGGVAPGKASQGFWIILLALGLLFFISPLGTWIQQLDLGSKSQELDKQREKFILSYMANGNAWTVIKSLFLIAFIPAVCEELFFRGIVMKFAYSLFKKWWVAIGFSALIFAAVHNSISEFVPIFIAGAVLGVVYYLTSSIWMNILLHLLFNGMQLLLGIYSNVQLEKWLEQPGNLVIVFCIAAAITALCLYMIYRARTPLPDKWSVMLAPAATEAE